jgi:hypothetical protein
MKKILKPILFILCFSVVLVVSDNMLKSNSTDDIRLKKFYKLKKNTVDAVFVGMSYVHLGINPVTIWNTSGILSYDLSSSSCPVWTSYYYIVECLKYQSPKVVAFEISGALGHETRNQFRFENLVSMRLSKNKVEAIMADVPKNEWIDFVLGFPIYHNFRLSIFERDTKPFFNGYEFALGITPVERPLIDLHDTKIYTDAHLIETASKSYEYLYKMIKLHNEGKVQLLFFSLPPFFGSELENYIKKISEENNIKFLNFNLLYDEIDFDFETDLRDGAHLNYYGAQKVSKYMAAYLHENYGLEDRRSSDEYSSWNVWAQQCVNYFKGQNQCISK